MPTRGASHSAGGNVDDGISDGENGSKELILQEQLILVRERYEAQLADLHRTTRMTTRGFLMSMVVTNERAGANPGAAVTEATAVAANEKDRANLEAAVPKEKDGGARTNPEEAHAGLGEKTFGG